MSACEETRGPHSPDPEKTICASESEGRGLHDVTDKPADLQATAQPTSRGVASYREFAGALIEFGLIDAPALERYAADSAEGVLGLSRALVKAGYLTPYQAAAVYQNKSRGLLIGNYLILDKLGQGGMGVVFKARHRTLGRLGALKILPPSFTRDRGAVTRFKREFEAAARLKHINLVAAFEADEDRGVHFLVMDYVVGINLDRVVSQQGPLPVSLAVDYLIQSARGLEAAHEKGIIHRDIKPGNLMLDQGTVRVLDLGLARVVDASNPFSKTVEGRLTQSGTYMGSVDYMAPEQAEDAHTADHRADIYSLGCTFFFLLTGHVPFSGPSTLKRMFAHQEHPAPSLRAVRQDVSPALEAVYQKMMAKKPEERPASMTEVIALLQASKHITGDDTSATAQPPHHRPVGTVSPETPLKPEVPPRTISDSVLFTRRLENDGALVDRELNLRDLVMDVRSDVCATSEPSAGETECATISDDHELNLRELAIELKKEAASPPVPKLPAASAQSLKRSALSRPEATPHPAPNPPSASAQPLKRSAPPRQDEAPHPAPKSYPAATPRKPAAAALQEQSPQAPSRLSGTPQSLKPAASPRHEQVLHAAPEPPASAPPFKRTASLRPEASSHALPQRLTDETQPPHPGALTPTRDSASNKVLAILVTLTAILLIVGVMIFISRRQPAVVKQESPPPVTNSHDSESSADLAPPPPL